MNNTKIQNCNNELLEKQKQQLIEDIVNGQHENYFKIFDIEAGCRKTRTAEEALAKMIQTTNRNAIFVRRTNADCKESADRINSLTGHIATLAYNNDTVPIDDRQRVHKDFPQYRVLIITHQKYKVLAEEQRKRSIFIKDRSVLVVDEFISDYKALSINMLEISTYKAILSYDSVIYTSFLKLIKMIEDFATSNPTGRYFVRHTAEFSTKQITKLVRLIKSNMTNEMLEMQIEKMISEKPDKIDVRLVQKFTSVKQLCKQIEDIKEFYNKTCVIENGKYSTTDSKCENWLLQNNILLDASGDLQLAYELNTQLYKLANCEKVLDHSNWTITNIIINSTTAGKARVKNYYNEVNKDIEKYGTTNTLVIGNQIDIQYINVPDRNKAYFGNITGSNKWYNLSNVVIIQTPNIEDTEYVLRYLHYTGKYIDNTFAKWTSKPSGRGNTSRYEFTDPRFERIRMLFIAEQTYQAIKRVNRNMDHVTNVIIYMNNPEVIQRLKEHLVGCKMVEVDGNNFIYQVTKKDDHIEEQKKNSYATRFTTLLAELWDGKHPSLQYRNKQGEVVSGLYLKQDIRTYLGIDTSANFSNRVLNKTGVISYCELRHIDISGKFIRLNDYNNMSA